MEIRSARVLVTGATGGLGPALATAFASRGARLVLSGRQAEVLDDLADRTGGRAVPADLSDRESVNELLRYAGPVDVLVSGAGVPATGEVWDYTPEQVDRALEVNLRAPIMLARAVSDGMRERGRGHIVFLSSLSARSAASQTAIYNATKFGLRGFALALRADLAPYGVGVSSVLPGPVRDVGMFAESGVSVPRMTTRSADQVARATVRVVERDRAESVVAPWSMRAVTALGALAPSVSAALSRRTGSDAVMSAVSEGQRAKR